MLADVFGQAVDWGYGNIAGLNAVSMFLITVFYSFQIYFDFSGYSDMAIGISWILNLDLPVNFDSPYKAYSVDRILEKMAYFADQVSDKVYLYTAGRKQEREPENLVATRLIVFLCSGIWHGASWMFVLWGALHGVAMVIDKGS